MNGRAWLQGLGLAAFVLVIAIVSAWGGYSYRSFERDLLAEMQGNLRQMGEDVRNSEIAEAGIILSVLRDIRAGKIDSATKVLESRLDGIVVTLSSSTHRGSEKMLAAIKAYREGVGEVETHSADSVRELVEQTLESVEIQQD